MVAEAIRARDYCAAHQLLARPRPKGYRFLVANALINGAKWRYAVPPGVQADVVSAAFKDRFQRGVLREYSATVAGVEMTPSESDALEEATQQFICALIATSAMADSDAQFTVELCERLMEAASRTETYCAVMVVLAGVVARAKTAAV